MSKLLEVRAAKRLTQEQLEQMSGVNQTTISAIETGKNRNPSWETVAKLAKALAVTPDELFPIESFEPIRIPGIEVRPKADRRTGVDRRGEGVA